MDSVSDTRRCWDCKQVLPLDDFPRNGSRQGYRCKPCKRADERKRRSLVPMEDKAEAARAFRAGMRRDKCAICGSVIDGHGICDDCAQAVDALGGLEGLKQAVRAVRYITSR